ncbi:MAG: hypothetical protein NWS37_07105 [Flavobacteriaceae bacterium]|nr:hypothetical protein [Flavobacteriaceae bacterium]
MLRIMFFILFISIANIDYAQELAAIDQRKLDAIEKTIELDVNQKQQIQDVFSKYAVLISDIDKQISNTQKSDIPEEQIPLRVSAYNQDKKDLRELRELEIKGILNSSQRLVYEEKIQPEKPQVLHFGLHDRANCNVCVK